MLLGEVISGNSILFDIGLIIIIATVLGFILKFVRQPLITAYILAGVLIGPFGLSLIKDYENIKILSELGIAFLLFMVGLELNAKKIKDVSSVSVFAALLEIGLLFLIGFIAAGLFGFTNIESIYLGLILAFSSTLVVVKLLIDRKELGTLHGRIILGTLLLQDIVAIIALKL